MVRCGNNVSYSGRQVFDKILISFQLLPDLPILSNVDIDSGACEEAIARISAHREIANLLLKGIGTSRGVITRPGTDG